MNLFKIYHKLIQVSRKIGIFRFLILISRHKKVTIFVKHTYMTKYFSTACKKMNLFKKKKKKVHKVLN